MTKSDLHILMLQGHCCECHGDFDAGIWSVPINVKVSWSHPTWSNFDGRGGIAYLCASCVQAMKDMEDTQDQRLMEMALETILEVVQFAPDGGIKYHPIEWGKDGKAKLTILPVIDFRPGQQIIVHEWSGAVTEGIFICKHDNGLDLKLLTKTQRLVDTGSGIMYESLPPGTGIYIEGTEIERIEIRKSNE